LKNPVKQSEALATTFGAEQVLTPPAQAVHTSADTTYPSLHLVAFAEALHSIALASLHVVQTLLAFLKNPELQVVSVLAFEQLLALVLVLPHSVQVTTPAAVVLKYPSKQSIVLVGSEQVLAPVPVQRSHNPVEAFK
jgi:hypothetical protein